MANNPQGGHQGGQPKTQQGGGQGQQPQKDQR